MGFIRDLIGVFSRDKPEERHDPLAYDTDDKPLFKEDIERYVLDEAERRRSERAELELQWQLNSNFLYGNQHCDINLVSGTIEEYEPYEDGSSFEVFNQIEPLFKTRQANLNKVNYAMSVNPRTSETDDIAKAKVSTALLRYKQSETDFNTFIKTATAWADTVGTCGVLCWWDQGKGDKVGEVSVDEIDEEGNPRHRVEYIFSGDVEYGLLTPYEILPESIYKQYMRDQRSVIVEQVMSVEDIYDLYGIDVEGGAEDTYSLSPVEGAGGLGYVATTQKVTSHTLDNAAKVITYFERPSRRYPEGRLIIIIGEELRYYGKLPYARIPITIIKSDEVNGQFFGRSFIQSLIPLQRSYNGLINSIHDYTKRSTLGSWMVEEGAVDDLEEFATNISMPGGIVKYKNGHDKPQPANVPDFPSMIYNEADKLYHDMEYIAGVSQMQVYGHQTGVTSGKAIENLTEIDNTRLSITSENVRGAVLDLARMWLEMYKKFAAGYRVLRVVGTNDAGDVLTWSKEDINSFDISYDTENEMIFSAEAQRQNAMNAFQMGLYLDESGMLSKTAKAKLLKAMKLQNFAELDDMIELQIARANRENGFLRNSGVPPVIMDADDHAIHIEEHEKAMLQQEYQSFKAQHPDLAEQFEAHVMEHKRIVAQKQAEAIKQAQMMGGGQNA